MFREPSWSLKVKIAGRYTCRFCGLGTFDHQIIDAHHKKRKCDRPDLAEVVENGECLCMFCHIREHYKMGDYWGAELIILRLSKLMRKRANWPKITFKQYQALRTVYHEGLNYDKAAKILGVSRQTVSAHLKKLKKLYPDILDEKGRLSFQPLPENYELFTKEVF